MRQPKAVGKNVVMKLIKEKEKEQLNKIIITEVNKKNPRFYEVIDSNNAKISPGSTVYVNGFCTPLEIDEIEYHICQEDAISVVLQ